MASTKISELPEAGPLTGDELYACVQGGSTKKTTLAVAGFAGVRSGIVAQTIPSDTDTALTFDSVIYDSGGFLPAMPSDHLEIPATRIYRLTAQCTFPGTGEGVDLTRRLSLIGSGPVTIATMEAVVPASGKGVTVCCTGDYPLTAGDIVSAIVYSEAVDADVVAWVSVEVLGLVPVVPPPDAYLYDQFVDANGTALADHTMDLGPGWTDAGSVYSIQDDECVCSAGGVNLAYSDAGEADGTLTCLSNFNAVETGVLFRLTDSANFWIAFRNGTDLKLWSIAGGAYTEMGAVTPTWLADLSEITVTLAGSSIGVSYNGSTINVVSTFNQSATNHGLYQQIGNAARWKNFRFGL